MQKAATAAFCDEMTSVIRFVCELRSYAFLWFGLSAVPYEVADSYALLWVVLYAVADNYAPLWVVPSEVADNCALLWVAQF